MTGCIFDIMVFLSNTRNYSRTPVRSLFCKHKLEKKREYGDCVQSVVSACFTVLAFSTFGGIGRKATIFYSQLAGNLLTVQYNIQYNQMLPWMCCTISFSLLRSAVLAGE